MFLIRALFLCVLAALLLQVIKSEETEDTDTVEEEIVRPRAVIVKFKRDNRHIFQNHAAVSFESREARAQNIHKLLSAHADETHAELFDELSIFPHLQVKSLWASNTALVYNCSSSMLRFIQSLPFVEEAREEMILPLPEFTVSAVEENQVEEMQWGVQKVQAHKVWAKSKRSNGATIRVATIDTGVRASHEALKDNFLGTGFWEDPVAGNSTPYDDVGHGTHTMGTICGLKGIGVAPGAKFMACKGCATSGCAQSHLLTCGQWIACPNPPECDKVPHLVSNSWGGGQGETWYNPVIDAWHAAGIIPIFSNGNSGPECGSANSPADQNVIAVGATDIDDKIAPFSSIGPSIRGVKKPDISAPGSKVVSSYFKSDTSYATLSGTSMACPHVAGVTALMLAENPALKYDDIKKYLFAGADTASLGPSNDCEDSSVFPNNIYGSGRVNAQNSIIKITLDDQNCAARALKRRRSRKSSSTSNVSIMQRARAQEMFGPQFQRP